MVRWSRREVRRPQLQRARAIATVTSTYRCHGGSRSEQSFASSPFARSIIASSVPRR